MGWARQLSAEDYLWRRSEKRLDQIRRRFHMVAMMNAEFLPAFSKLVERLSTCLPSGRSADNHPPRRSVAVGLPRRAQHRPAYYSVFARQGLSLFVDRPWRAQYRLVAWQFNRK